MLRWRRPDLSALQLSDTVISGLRVRAEGADPFVAADPSPGPSLPSFGAFATTAARSKASIEAASATGSVGLKRPIDHNDSGAMRSAEPLQQPTAKEGPSVGVSEADAEQQPPKPKKRIRIKTERRREQCRANQARYRNKQRALRLELSGALGQLRREVRELELHRRSLTYGRHAKLSPWSIAVDFVRHLARDPGVLLQSSSGLANTADNESGASNEDPYVEAQGKFLRLALASEVHLVGSACHGATSLIEQWARWADCLERHEIQLVRIEQANGYPNSLMATTRVVVDLYDSNMRRLFPCLDDDDDTSNSLKQKLRGRRVAFESVMRFEHHPTTSVITRLRVEMDVISPLAQIVESLAAVARLLEGSPLTTTAFLGCGDDESSSATSRMDERRDWDME